jgi:hypothetical protein
MNLPNEVAVRHEHLHAIESFSSPPARARIPWIRLMTSAATVAPDPRGQHYGVGVRSGSHRDDAPRSSYGAHGKSVSDPAMGADAAAVALVTR